MPLNSEVKYECCYISTCPHGLNALMYNEAKGNLGVHLAKLTALRKEPGQLSR